MNELSNNKCLMNHVELCELINKLRAEEGNRKELRSHTLIEKIRKEVETMKKLGLSTEQNFLFSEYKDKSGKTKIVEQQFKLPTTYKEALQQLLQQVEENEKLLNVIEEQEDTIDSLKAVGISEPYNVQSMCQHLPGKPYPNEVYNKLIELGWLCKTNVATYNVTIKGRNKIYKHGRGICFYIKGWNEFKNCLKSRNKNQ